MNLKRFAATTLTIAFAVVISPRRVLASDTADVTAAVHGFVDNLDDKTLEKALAWCDSPVSILDEFPPHEWHGPTACADWWKAFNAYNEQNGITDGDATLGHAMERGPHRRSRVFCRSHDLQLQAAWETG